MDPVVRAHWRSLVHRLRSTFPNATVGIELGDPHDFPAARDMAYCVVERPPIVVVAPKLAEQSIDRIRGVLAHELGHAAWILSGDLDHSEAEADALAHALLGVRIGYDAADVQTTRKDCLRKRPAYLPR